MTHSYLTTHHCQYFSVLQSRAATAATPSAQPNSEGFESSKRLLSIHELNEMVIDPEKYDALKLKPYFRRIPRESLVMHSFVLSWYSFTVFAVFIIFGTAAITYYDVYVTKESVEPKDKAWAKDLNIYQKMWYDFRKKRNKLNDADNQTPEFR
eukprot:CAMPEP_0197055870 /NCGR_PEP_ID=MMETSP1384-20130603/74420_1 /TAXON_ID=29189 /ORGANISM="Ammonia sp." /LENGTH=152 /DNA_ID=CAMNT_0042489611 /DNA_START=101 /DNA_END=559 /DNA_ORIENTATION=+